MNASSKSDNTKNKNEPTLKSFGLDASVYRHYWALISKRKKILLIIVYLSIFATFFGLYVAKQPTDWFVLIILSLLLLTVVESGYDLFWLGRLLMPNLSKELEEIRDKVGPFEESFHKHTLEHLESFYRTKLYRKRSGSSEFQVSLAEFGAILQILETQNDKLITKRFSSDELKKYRDYYFRRNGSKVPLSRIQTTPDQTKVVTRGFSAAINFAQAVSKPVAKPVVEAPEEVYRSARKVDWAERNKQQALTGKRGEAVVLEIERRYLRSVNCNDLAERVNNVAVEVGDGLGYDILSFFPNGKQKYIEVKSTVGSIKSVFNISRNELGFLQEHQKDAFVCRVQTTIDGDDIYFRYISSGDVVSAEITPVKYLVGINK